MQTRFKSIAQPFEGPQLKFKGSKFIGRAFPFHSEEEAMACLKRIRQEEPKANHHCFAYRLGPDGSSFRFSDDGEPSSTAGKPILGQLQAFDLVNVLLVVTRYFGGTKLGTGGLIQAYRESAKACLEQADRIEVELTQILELTFDYSLMNEVMRLLKTMQLQVLESQSGMRAVLKVSVPLAKLGDFRSRVSLIRGVSVKL